MLKLFVVFIDISGENRDSTAIMKFTTSASFQILIRSFLMITFPSHLTLHKDLQLKERR